MFGDSGKARIVFEDGTIMNIVATSLSMTQQTTDLCFNPLNNYMDTNTVNGSMDFVMTEWIQESKPDTIKDKRVEDCTPDELLFAVRHKLQNK